MSTLLMSNLSLYDLRLKLEGILSEDLGKFSNNQPAIYSGREYPKGKITGLACFIQDIPEQVSAKPATGHLRAITEHFVITLVQFDRKKNTTSAMRKIQKNFIIASCDVVPSNAEDFEQCIIRIRNYGFI